MNPKFIKQQKYWEYFLAIEDDLVKTSRFVEFCPDNYKTYSVEFARIILASSSEFDVIAKAICKEIDPSSNANNIDEYRSVILSRYPRFYTMQIDIPRYNLSFKPWDTWSNQENPTWWQSYNNVKHQRDLFYNEATLETALNSVAGLLCGSLHYFRSILGCHVSLNPFPQLFETKNVSRFVDGTNSWPFDLPY